MLNNPVFLAVGFVMFLAFVLKAVVEYRHFRNARKTARKVALRLEEASRLEQLRSRRLTPRDVAELRKVLDAFPVNQ